MTPTGGFNFGQPTNTATVNPLTSGTGFSFGSTIQNLNSAPGVAYGQGTPTTSLTGLLGSSTAANANFSQPTSSSGLNFGQGGILGTTLTSGGQFSTSGGSFGTLSSQASNPSGGLFGTTPQVSNTGGLFGTTSQSSAAGGLFGTTNQPSSTGGLFGTTPQVSSTGALLGPSSQATASTGGLFPSANQQPISSVSPLSTGLTIQPTGTSQLPTSNPGLFGITSQGSSLAGIPQSGTGIAFGTTSQAATSGSQFQLNPNSPANVSGLFAQGGGSSTLTSSGTGLFAPSSGFKLGTDQSTAVTSTPVLGLGGTGPTSIASTSGLGGFQSPSLGAGIGSVSTKGDGKCIKETPLPQDIFATLAVFENYKDVEKRASEENVRQTAAPFHKLCDDTKKLRQHIIKLSNQHAQLHASARKLKSSVIQEAENVEMTRRTQDTPVSLQGNNKAPEQYFLRLVRSFEEKMTSCRNKIEEVEKCSRPNGETSEITSEDMKEVLRKEHEMVKVLAAKVYTLHNQLVNYCSKNNSILPQPEALFRPASHIENEAISISNKNSSVLRPCIGDGGSGLLNFQSGQQRAKAFALGAAPPILSLGQMSVPSILSQPNSGGIFGPSQNTFRGTTSNLNLSNSFNNPNTSFSFNQSIGGTGGLFGASSPGTLAKGSPSFFGSPKPLGKSFSENDESQRKRRI